MSEEKKIVTLNFEIDYYTGISRRMYSSQPDKYYHFNRAMSGEYFEEKSLSSDGEEVISFSKVKKEKCPLSQMEIDEPYFCLETGTTYELEFIKEYVRRCIGTISDPLTRKKYKVFHMSLFLYYFLEL